MIEELLKKMHEAVRLADDIKQVSEASGEFFAILLMADLEHLEKALLDGLSRYKEVKKENPDTVRDISVDKIEDKIALLGCLMRFRDDVAKSTEVGKHCLKKYEEFKAMDSK